MQRGKLPPCLFVAGTAAAGHAPCLKPFANLSLANKHHLNFVIALHCIALVSLNFGLLHEVRGP